MAAETYHRELEALQEDIRQLRKDLKSIMETIGEDGKARLHQAGHRLTGFARDRIDQVRDAAEIAFAKVRKLGRSTKETIEKQIQEKPVLTLLAAVGVGMLLGKILRRK